MLASKLRGAVRLAGGHGNNLGLRAQGKRIGMDRGNESGAYQSNADAALHVFTRLADS
jgi:hypothetical protein